MTIRTRALAAARDDLTELCRSTPHVFERGVWSGDRALLTVNLPYLGVRAGRLDEPGREEGFELGIELVPDFPVAAPIVRFLGQRSLQHPSYSLVLGRFCLGTDAWLPALGVHHYVVLHLQAVLGLAGIDTTRAFVNEPEAEAAARYYQALRARGELPLATPVFPTLTPARVGADRPRPAPLLEVREGTTFARQALAGTSWRALSEASRSSLAWLRARLAGPDLALQDADGVPVLEARGPTAGAALEALRAARSRHEPAVLALARPEVARLIAGALTPTFDPHEKESPS